MKKTIQVYSESCPYIPENAEEFLAFWKGKIELIPEKDRGTAIIELEAEDSYGHPIIEVSVRYTREEAAQERKTREAEAANRNESIRQRDLAELERLKGKYE